MIVAPIMEEEDEETRKDERSQVQISPDLPGLTQIFEVKSENKPLQWSDEMKSNLNTTSNVELELPKAVSSYNAILSEPINVKSEEDLLRTIKSENLELKHKNATTSVSHINLA